MSIVAVVGAGTLGGSLAHILAAHERVREVRLIDPTDTVAAGMALDIKQAGAVERFDTNVVAHRDLRAAIGADVIVLTGGADQPETEWGDNEGLAMLRQLASLNRRALTVCGGAGHRRLVERGVAETSLARRRLIGAAPFALHFALRAVVAVELQCSALDVSLAVLGTPPDRVVIPWSEASVRGIALSRLLSPQRLAALQTKIIRMWPPGPYTLAAATARLCESVLQGTAIYGVTCYLVLDGELGVRGRAVATTVALDASGVISVAEPSLSVREQVALDNALLPP